MMALWVWWTIGSFLVLELASRVLETQGWRMLCIYCAIPPMLSTFGLFWVDESPTWLLIKGRKREAENVLKSAATMNSIDIGTIELVEEKEHPLDVRLLFKDDNAKRTALVWVICFVQTFLYYGIVLYLPRAFLSLMRGDGEAATALHDGNTQYPYWALFASIGGELIGNVLALFLVRSFSRSSLSAFFFAGFGLSFPVIITGVSDIFMVLAAMFARLCATIAGNLSWLIAPEAYPTEVRATGHSWANMVARLGALATTYWARASVPTAVMFAGYSTLAFIAAAASWALPPGIMIGSEVSSKKLL
jgi:MFS family permease